MSNNEHPYADILRAIADGKTIQVEMQDGSWYSLRRETALEYVINGKTLRVKPRTIWIGEYEVPEPISNPPEIGDEYFVAAPSEEDFYHSHIWDGDLFDFMWLYRGIVHLDKESAILHTKALISLTEQK